MFLFIEKVEGFDKLHQVERVDLNLNNFGGSLTNSVANLSSQLSQFYIGGNQITGTIPASFVMFQKMQSLNLNVSKLSGEIPLSIGNLSLLFQLDLSNNVLEGSIHPGVGNCQNLQYLDLSHNRISGTIPLQVIGLSYLSLLLNLSHNSFNGKPTL